MNKKILLVLLAVIGLAVLTGCGNVARAQRNIQRAFPDAELYEIPKTRGQYVIKDQSGQIFYVEEAGEFSTTNAMVIVKIFNER